jgi:ABC-type transport system substrate-binding protein
MAIMIVSMFSALPAMAFIYPDTTVDSLYEFYGPHIDMVQNKLYSDTDSMWTALGEGDIDISDWPITATFRTQFSVEPYLSNITVVTAGGEAGYYQLDFNAWYKPKLGQIMPYISNATYKYGVNDPNGRPNPVFFNDSAYWAANHIAFPPISTNVSFRLAVAALFNRTLYEQRIGAGFIQIQTLVPSYMGGYIWAACPGYTYNSTLALEYFAAAKIKCDAGSGWARYWDLNNDGVAQQVEKDACVIRMTWRADKARKEAGLMVRDELIAMNFTMHPTFTRQCDFDTNYQQAMLDKNYHMTTFGWIYVGPDPDFIYDTYHIANYWDSETSSCPNTAGLNDTIMNYWSEMVKFNDTAAGAKLSAIEWQKRCWAINAHLPLCSTNRYMANAKYYSGGTNGNFPPSDDGENTYRRVNTANASSTKRAWLGMCNQDGVGSNSWFTLLNAYPELNDSKLYGSNGKMTLRYGWSQQAAPTHMNPMVSEWYWDAILIGEIYDTMGYRDPYDLSTWKGDLAESWQAGTWYDSLAKVDKSKVTVTIRSDAKFIDGTPVTMGDVIYSLVDAGKTMIAKGYPPPWWWPTGSQVRSLSLIDAYTVEILYDVLSFLAESWTLGFYIIPKHIWKPIIESATPNPPTAMVPDPNMIGSGPFRYANRTSLQSVLLVANRPGSVVKTDESGSRLITSPGYHAYFPEKEMIYTSDGKYKYNPGTAVTFNVKTDNLWTGGSLNIHDTVKITWPNATSPPQPNPNATIIEYDMTLAASASNITTFTYTWPKCRTAIEVWSNITTPGEFFNETFYYKKFIWGSIREDVTGSNIFTDYNYYYPYTPASAYNATIMTPDCKVDAKDVSGAAAAFGSKPGQVKWWSVADIIHDYKIDAKDISAIASKFGFK